jgi:hypothetical protein
MTDEPTIDEFTEEWLKGLPNDHLVEVFIEVNLERSGSSFAQRALVRAEMLRRLR